MAPIHSSLHLYTQHRKKVKNYYSEKKLSINTQKSSRVNRIFPSSPSPPPSPPRSVPDRGGGAGPDRRGTGAGTGPDRRGTGAGTGPDPDRTRTGAGPEPDRTRTGRPARDRTGPEPAGPAGPGRTPPPPEPGTGGIANSLDDVGG
jgi:hypothetical protein